MGPLDGPDFLLFYDSTHEMSKENREAASQVDVHHSGSDFVLQNIPLLLHKCSVGNRSNRSPPPP